jgi:carbon-monoxide dehydrogenase iron sulfur subunit
MRLVIDQSVCTGCRCCELACAARHEREFAPARARIRIRSSREQHAAFIDVCTQCAEEACIEACPVDAIARDPADGVVKIDYELCTQCMECVGACPYNAMFVDVTTDLPIKCDLCGGDPECVKFCRPEALTFEA